MRNKRLSQVSVGLPVALIKEGSVYVAYTPALDISTSGKTKYEAKKNFNELVTIYFEEFVDNPRALEEVLLSLGWRRQQNSWQPPKITNIVQDVQVNFAV